MREASREAGVLEIREFESRRVLLKISAFRNSGIVREAGVLEMGYFNGGRVVREECFWQLL